jgi:hypothetical protein
MKDTFNGDRPVAIKVLHTSYSALGYQEADCLRRLNTADVNGFASVVHLHVCVLFKLGDICKCFVGTVRQTAAPIYLFFYEINYNRMIHVSSDAQISV